MDARRITMNTSREQETINALRKKYNTINASREQKTINSFNRDRHNTLRQHNQ